VMLFDPGTLTLTAGGFTSGAIARCGG
jgi:hypothetical protein